MTLKELAAKLESLAIYKSELKSAYSKEFSGGTINQLETDLKRQIQYIEETKQRIQELEDIILFEDEIPF